MNPNQARGFIELAIAFLGITKWPVLGVGGVSGWLAYQRYSDTSGKGDVPMVIFFIVACLCLGWFIGGLMAGE